MALTLAAAHQVDRVTPAWWQTATRAAWGKPKITRPAQRPRLGQGRPRTVGSKPASGSHTSSPRQPPAAMRAAWRPRPSTATVHRINPASGRRHRPETCRQEPADRAHPNSGGEEYLALLGIGRRDINAGRGQDQERQVRLPCLWSKEASDQATAGVAATNPARIQRGPGTGCGPNARSPAPTTRHPAPRPAMIRGWMSAERRVNNQQQGAASPGTGPTSCWRCALSGDHLPSPAATARLLPSPLAVGVPPSSRCGHETRNPADTRISTG